MMEKLATGDLVSYQQQRERRRRDQGRALPRTLSLAIGAAILWMAAGRGARRVQRDDARAGRRDFAVNVLALIGISVPVFWLGALVNYYLGYKLGWFPNGGYVPMSEGGLWEWVYHLFMPWTVLAILFIGVYSRVLRGTILETMNEDFVRTARAKGLSEREVHAPATSCAPRSSRSSRCGAWTSASCIGGGAILTEAVFDLQGVGQYYAESVSQLDVPPVHGGHDLRRGVHRRAEHDRGHPLRGARPEDPALMTEPACPCSPSTTCACASAPRTASSAPSTASRLELRAGEVLAIVGESGSGKSVTALTLMGLTRGPNTEIEGAARLHGEDLITADDDRLRRMRGAELAIIFQDPMTSLNPVQRIGKQIAEQILAHEDIDRDQARDRVLELLKRVGIPQAETRIDALPARVLGRHAPARDDRDGAVVQAEGAHRRRADHRARRDDPGADPRPAARPEGADRARPSSSSRTTSAWSPRSPTGSP